MKRLLLSLSFISPIAMIVKYRDIKQAITKCETQSEWNATRSLFRYTFEQYKTKYPTWYYSLETMLKNKKNIIENFSERSVEKKSLHTEPITDARLSSGVNKQVAHYLSSFTFMLSEALL